MDMLNWSGDEVRIIEDNLTSTMAVAAVAMQGARNVRPHYWFVKMGSYEKGF